MSKLQEDSRRELIAKAKRSDDYTTDKTGGKNRHQRRLKSRIAKSVKEYNQIDMNKLFKEDILDVNIRVNGETNTYLVQISFSGFLNSLAKMLDEESTIEDVDFRKVLKALIDAFNHSDVYVHCTCPDWCLEGSTQIKLLNGEIVTIEELLSRYLNNEELWVYSTDENGDFKPGLVSDVWISGYTSEMIKVVLDNDKEILTTPTHKYMLRNGQYIEANKLTINDSLMPLYFKSDRRGYEQVKYNSTQKYHSTYKLVAQECFSDELKEVELQVTPSDNMPYKVAIHHKDFNKSNNTPNNLQVMTAREHWDYHASLMKDKWQDEKFRQESAQRTKKHIAVLNANPTEALVAARKNFIEKGHEYWRTTEGRAKKSAEFKQTREVYYVNETEEQKQTRKEKMYTDQWKQNLGNAQKAVWENYSEEEYKQRCEVNRLSNQKSKALRSQRGKEIWEQKTEQEKQAWGIQQSVAVKKSWVDHPEKYLTEKFRAARKNAFNYERTPEIEQQRKITKISHVIQKILDNHEIPSEETYEKYRTSGYPRYTVVFSNWAELSDYFALNHKVKSIEYIYYDEPIPVYDLTVNKYNNFYVDAGVVLHNCYRSSYWSTINGTNAVPNENRNLPSDETNPDDTKGYCKHVNLVLNNNSWLNKVASVICNYIKYMHTHYEKLYADVIYPAIFDKEYEEPVQQDMFNQMNDTAEDELETDENAIDISNKWARTKNQFKPGWSADIEPEEKPLNNQEKMFDLDNIDAEENSEN